MSIPIVAIVGRPNVGKSTLFNKLIGRRLSIVEDTPGVTRDRIYADSEWNNKIFSLIDTGGLEPETNDFITLKIKAQTEVAIHSSNVIIFVTDMTNGITTADIEIANILLKSGKPVILCVNKCDSIGNLPIEYYEFYNLGLGDPVPVSSVHGHGTGDLLDEVFKYINFDDVNIESTNIKVAVVGKPNVGKSTLVNLLSNEDRVIVSDVPGTTRDCIDSIVKYNNDEFLFIDTAGIRRKSKVLENIERYSVMRSHMAVDRSDVCIIMLDSVTGYTEQDSKIAGYVHNQGKASIIVVNKWDLLDKDTHTMENYKKQLKNSFSFMSYVPFLFISAKNNQRVNKIFNLVKEVNHKNSFKIRTGVLNEFLAKITSKVQPPTDKGKRLKIYYMTQMSIKPPTFVIFVNNYDLFHFSYQRYIENQLRDTFDLDGTPIKFVIRERDRDDQ